MKTLSLGTILWLTTMFVMISGQRQRIRRNNRRRALPERRALPDRNSPRPRKYWREIQEVPEPVPQAEPTGEATQQRRPGPRKSEPKARPLHLEGGLSRVFRIPVPPQEPPAEETEDQSADEQTEEEMVVEQNEAVDPAHNQQSDENLEDLAKRTKTQKNSKKTNTVSATSTEGMMWGRVQGMQGSGASQQSEGAVEGSDAAQQDEGLIEGESMEDVKSRGETQQYHQNPET